MKLVEKSFGPIDKANINRHSLAILVSFQQYEAIQKGWKGKDGRANDSDFLYQRVRLPLLWDEKKECELWDLRNYCTMKDDWRNKYIYNITLVILHPYDYIAMQNKASLYWVQITQNTGFAENIGSSGNISRRLITLPFSLQQDGKVAVQQI